MTRWLLLLAACSHEPRAVPLAPRVAADATLVAVDARVDAAVDVVAPMDAPVDAGPRDLDEALAALRARGFDNAADTIARRIAQRAPKMKLEPASAFAAATAIVEHADTFRALHDVMPRSTVELARATRERGVTIDDAAAIARYLVGVVAALKLARLETFDENHSHVTGREWSEIDYSGEGMTWQQQRDDWTPKGVTSFKRAAFIHAYFVGAERLPHWRRVYQPRGKMRDVAAPQ